MPGVVIRGLPVDKEDQSIKSNTGLHTRANLRQNSHIQSKTHTDLAAVLALVLRRHYYRANGALSLTFRRH